MQKNPLTIRGHLRRCWLFTWRAPVESIRRHLPSILTPVTHGGFAFWNAVVCEVRDLRPAPLPAWCGLSYWHVGYRIYVHAPLADGRELEGLYFVRSDCDRRIVAWPGNVLADFRFRVGEIHVNESGPSVQGDVQVEGANAHFQLDRNATPTLSTGSPFATLHDAEAALKYPPAGIATAGLTHLNVVRIAREEKAWRSRAIAAPRLDFEFFANEPVTPELCFEVDPIDYQWNRGELVEVAR
ncbi:MAG: DUF2071 domain-containing protein [Chthoniobacteraceae bacterium]